MVSALPSQNGPTFGAPSKNGGLLGLRRDGWTEGVAGMCGPNGNPMATHAALRRGDRWAAEKRHALWIPTGDDVSQRAGMRKNPPYRCMKPRER